MDKRTVKKNSKKNKGKLGAYAPIPYNYYYYYNLTNILG